MDIANERRNAAAFFALAGLEAGMLGVLAMLAWLGAASAFYRRSVWTSANLMGSLFYGEAALRPGFGVRTLSGLSVYLLVYSLLGAGFALAERERFPRLRLILIGVIAGLAWYWFAFHFLLERVDPLVWLYTHDRPMLIGHVFYGALLARYPLYLRRLRGELPAPVVAPPPQVLEQTPTAAPGPEPADPPPTDTPHPEN